MSATAPTQSAEAVGYLYDVLERLTAAVEGVNAYTASAATMTGWADALDELAATIATAGRRTIHAQAS